MAIALDTTSSGQSTGTSSLTISHTCTGSDLVLVCGGFLGGSGSSSGWSATYNGSAMTKIAQVGAAGDAVLFYIVNPATGTHDIVLSGSSTSIGIGAASYTGVKQTGFPDSQGTGTNSSGNALNVSTTVVAANCWLVGAGMQVNAGGNNLLSNRTGRVNIQNVTGQGFGMVLCDSNGTVSAGSQTIQYQNGGAGTQITGIAISMAPAGSSSTNFFLLF